MAAVDGDQSALAQQLDADHYKGLAPYGSYVGRAILFHTMAFNENLKGTTPEELRWWILSPGTDLSFIDDARRRFVQGSAYLDDRPNVPLRFLAEANLTQILRRQEQHADPGEARAQLNDRIKSILGGTVFNLYAFPGGPYEVPDDAGAGKPSLVLMGSMPSRLHRTMSPSPSSTSCPIINRTASKEWYQRSEHEPALAIHQCYRHVIYAFKHRIDGAELDLAHSAIDVQSASDKPGQGQKRWSKSCAPTTNYASPKTSRTRRPISTTAGP